MVFTILLLIVFGLTTVAGWNIVLDVTTQAGGAYGGEPFSIQPVITVNNKKGELQSSFEGRITVQVHTFPNGKYEPVWKEGESVPTAAADTFVSESVADGQVTFVGLGIDIAGEGRQLKFVVYDEHDLIMDNVIGDEFTVEVGERYRMGFVTQPEMAYGGAIFGSQPLLAIQDRGGNTVTDVNEGMVAVAFQTSPEGSTLRCIEEDGFNVSVKNGLANFQRVFINEAGKHYSLRFSTDIVLEGHSEVTSNDFSVGVGPAAEVVLIHDASDGAVSGGKAFTRQPRVELHDAGGNVLVNDSSSAIRVSFYSNPSRGELSPVSGTTELLRQGVVQFRSLSIDKAGAGYRLKYVFLLYEDAQLKETSIFAHGSYFNVEIGPPHQLSFLQHSSGGWAGNQPFPIQPKVALLDAGGNVVVGDSVSTVSAHVTSSLAHSSRVIIDTSGDAIPSVANVIFAQSIKDDERSSYGPGDTIAIDVVFSQEVTIFQTNDDSSLPQILLNTINSGGSEAVYGELILAQEGSFSRTVTFEYLVKTGHLQTELDYLSIDSLHANDYSIEDAFGRSANLDLPATGSSSSLPASQVIGISDSRPIVESITADLPMGDYSVGDEVSFSVAFDREVEVTGNPRLPLNLHSSRTATYVDGSSTKSLVFNFVVLQGDDTARLDISETMGAELLFPTFDDSILLLVNGPGPSPIQADPKISGISLPVDQTIAIDTTPPYVTSITPQDSTTPNGVYAVGDTVFLEVSFDKPVEVDIGLELALNTDSGVARYAYGSGTETLVMQYIVEEGDVTSKLGFGDTLVAQSTEGGRSPAIGRVRRKSLSPTTNANLDISYLPSLTDTHSIVIDGERPQLLDVSFAESDEGNAFARGDSLTILLHFSAAVVINESSPPMLGLLVGANERWATYSSGSGSPTLNFSYQVAVGDSSTPLEFQYRRLCDQSIDCINTRGLVVRLSATLELDADLNTDFSEQGIAIAESSETGVTIDTSMAPVTTVVSTTTSTTTGTYGVGEIVDIQVKFTDQVFLPSTPGTMPTLLLNTGNSASYYAGQETDTLTFRLISTESDSTSGLDWAVDPVTSSAITCTSTCIMENANGVAVDIRFYDSVNSISLVASIEPVIVFDTSPPRIVSINTNKAKSPFCHPLCTYTVGEEVDVYVRFDGPVVAQGDKISLVMDVGINGVQNIQAVYVPSRSTENQLVFVYTVSNGHSSNGASLNYICSQSLCSLQLAGSTELKGAASIPTLEVDLTLPPCSEHGLSGDALRPILVDTSGQPNVVDVSSTASDGEYGPGSTVEVSVQFSKTVVVSGEPFLTFDVGTPQAGIANYKGGSGSSILLFEYTVDLGHTSLDLDYIDSHSLYLGFDGVNSGSIKQASTNPSIDANLDLVLPGTIGSLGANSDIQVNSKTPFISLITAVPGEYSTGDKITIRLQFSRPVDINGAPSLVLKAGLLVDRIAKYESQPTDRTVEFSYTVQLGDSADYLDYGSDEELLPSSNMSLRLNGGWIRLKSTNHVLDADLHINPIDGYLDGDKEVDVTEGVALFRDLKIGQRGQDFKIWFQCNVPSTGGALQVAEVVKIDASIEYEVQGGLTNRDPGDLYGGAVSLYGDVLAVGAPGKLNPTLEIQVLSVYSEAAIEEHEVQIIATSVNRSEAVVSAQEISTCADAGETVKGSFTLTYSIDGVYAFSSPIEFNSDVDADQLKSVLEQELHLEGLMATSKIINPACESLNSWTWSITFLDSSEGVGVLETNGILLIGSGAYISQSVPARDVDMLRGSFRLQNPFNGMISREIAHDASGNAVKEAIQEDLAILVLSVQAENMDSENNAIAELGRRWTVIFSHHVGLYGEDTNVPQLQATSDGMLGKDSHVWTHTGFEGHGVLSGSFAISFRGSDPSYFVPYDSSEEEVKAALESLDSINEVTVSDRRIFSNEVGKSGFSWTITFNSVNKLTDYGWLLDPGGATSNGNLPTLEVTGHLIGWNAGYVVQSETGRGEEDTQAQWMAKQKGDDGSGSGIVDIFRNVRETWRREATVLPYDYDSKDKFGASVSIVDGYLLVGAPSKEVDGLPEQQTMNCKGPGSDGYFFITFRGFKSSAIPYDATMIDIQNAIVGLHGGTDNIHPTPQLLFTSGSEGWDGLSSGFCNGSEKSISITFLTPDGGGISTVEKRSGDLEMVKVDASNLIGATISVDEHRAGTVAPMGKDLNNSEPTGKQSGSAYLYQRHLPCSYCEPVWTQIKKFTPMNGLDAPSDAAEFGWSSVFVTGADETSNLAMIGSPGFDHESGKVYIFNAIQGSWMLLDSLTDKNWNHEGIKGGRFGASLDADSDTILVGSPSGHANGKSAVYVFRRSDKGKPFLASQAIYGPDDLGHGDRFGHSIALYNNKAVLCAPHKMAHAIYNSILPQESEQVGACYVYSREDKSSAFKLEQQLIPSNVLPGDRFGWSVAMTSNRIVVGQVEKTPCKIRPPRAVQVIKTFCEEPPCKNAAASTFRLQWVGTPRLTPFLSASTTANQMRDAIETSLISSAVFVTRSELSDEDDGHTWRITFDSNDSMFRNVNNIPHIQCGVFVTSTLSCDSYVEHDIAQKARGKAHLFDFDESSQTWTEQSFLFSNAPQQQDFLGTSVTIDGNFAVAGSPNRELLNVNSGAALIYDISFLNLNFSDGPYSLNEGDVLDINVERSSSASRQVVSLRTMDPNAEDDLQHHVNDLFSTKISLDASNHRTPVELLTGNTAFGRSQFYGSFERRSLFIHGMYDIKGINDYELLSFEGQFKPGESVISTKFRTTDDTILESPSEHVTVQLNMRGMFASQLGRLKTDIAITENGDGVSTEGNVQYQVLDGHNHEELGRMGTAIDIERAAGMMIVGSDQTSGVDANGNKLNSVGSASLFKRSLSGSWDYMETLSPPLGDILANMNFGQSVAISKPYGRDDITVLIGAPGAAATYVYVLQPSTSSWALQASLTSNDATLSSEDRFGGRGGIALNEDIAFVGSSSVEQVYVFRRSFVADKGFVKWDSYSILRSNDYDFDVYGKDFTVRHMHEQGFGWALAASHRTLLVGAPHADYGNRGDVNTREHFDTNGIHNKGLGKGKVFSFYSQPHVQIVTLQSDEIITAGSFRLMLNNHQGVEEDLSGIITHDSTPAAFKLALEEMITVGKVNIEANEKIEGNVYTMSWRISFLSNFQDSFPALVPVCYEHGCDDCQKLRVSVLSTVEPFFAVTSTHSLEPFTQDREMQPRDATSTDLFGATVALDGPQAIIGSMWGAAKTRTTWDFETGDLKGWSATGTAFQYQPSFGDNIKHRAVYDGYGTAASQASGEPQSSRLVGRYYIATFEKRGGEEDNYQIPDQQFSLGSTQGDGPTGTLTSDPFIIRGSTVSFLIGGGCNHLVSYIELLVDGFPSLRATGKCLEKMERIYWDVSMFLHRAGQVRIVDRGSNKWDHINIDEIQFSWDNGGACLVNNFGQCAEGGGALPKKSESELEKQHYTGREESPMAGAAYMFLHECEGLRLDDLSPSNSNCAWVEQERLVASDKRAGDLFGVSVDVDHEQGIALVGSSHASAYGFYQEPISVHPYTNSTMPSAIAEDLEDLMKSGRTYSATGGNIRLIDYLIQKGQISAEEASKFTEQAGSVYVFLREPARYGPSGEIAHKAFWRTTEDSKFAPPDVAARDHFGTSVALDGTTAAMGATGRDGHAENGGGAFVYDMEWVRVKFQQVEFVALEGQQVVKVFVERDLSWSNQRYSIGYSTSDLTAVGVDTAKFDGCMDSPSPGRDGCGDYEQSSGEVTFNPGEKHAYFTIRIMDDQCIENHMEYVQLSLHQIGGSPLRGETRRAQLRIDDNDWPNHVLSMNCSGGIS